MDKYTNRLIEEWKQHGKIIIAFDYDDTVSPWRLNTEDDCKKVINILIDAQHVGAHLVCFTACKEDRHPEIKRYLSERGLQTDTINQNPIELPYGNQNKVYANIFIDDRAGLDTALEMLSTAMYPHESIQIWPTS